MKKFHFLPVLLLLLMPILAEGQIKIEKVNETADASIPKEQAIFEFVSNRPDLMIVARNIDIVDPEIYPEGDLTRYKVRLKLSNGVDKVLDRNFTLKVRETVVQENYSIKRIKGGYRYEVKAIVPDVVINKNDKSSPTDVNTEKGKVQIVLQSKYQLDIKLIGVNGGSFSSSTTDDGLSQYNVYVPIDSLESSSMAEPQLMVSVKNSKSNTIYIDISGQEHKLKKTYVIYREDMPANKEQRGYVVFNIFPAELGTMISFDGERNIPVSNGTYQKYVRYGAYPYTVSATNEYHEDTGIVILNRDRVEKNITMKERFGTVVVTGSKCIGATIYLDGEKKGVKAATPFEMKTVLSGKHTLMVTKERCETYVEEINLEDGQRIERAPEMIVSYAHLIFTVEGDAEIWINNKYYAKGRAEGDFKGEVVVECKKEHHNSTSQKVYARPNDPQRVIPLDPPTPKYGRLRIESTPSKAQIYIDGVQLKEGTPQVLSAIIEGKHVVRVSYKGKADEYRDVEIREGEESKIIAILRDATSIKLHLSVKVPRYNVKVNGRDLGQLKSIELPVGDHNVVVEAEGYEPFSKIVSVPGLKDLKIVLHPKSYKVVFTCDDPDIRVQRDGNANDFRVNSTPIGFDYGQHVISIIKDGNKFYEAKVFIEKDTTIEIDIASLESENDADAASARTKGSKGKAKEKKAEKSVGKPAEKPKVVITEEVTEEQPKSVIEPETQVSTTETEVVEDIYDEAYDSEVLDDEDLLEDESLDQQFKYKDFSRWTLDINMARHVYKGSMYLYEYSNSYLLGGTLAITGKRGWGFYLTGYFGESRYYHGFNIYGIPNFDYSKSDEPSRDGVGILGFVRRLGSPRSVIDAQLYLGAGALFHQTYVAKQRYVYEPSVQDYVNYTYLRKNGVMPKLCIDAGLRFGLDHRTKFGWFNFTLGGMYVVGIDRFYLTGGISLGNAAVAGALIGYLGIPSMF